MVNADELDRFADKVKPGTMSEYFVFDAVMPRRGKDDWLERLTSPAESGQSKGESNGEV